MSANRELLRGVMIVWITLCVSGCQTTKQYKVLSDNSESVAQLTVSAAADMATDGSGLVVSIDIINHTAHGVYIPTSISTSYTEGPMPFFLVYAGDGLVVLFIGAARVPWWDAGGVVRMTHLPTKYQDRRRFLLSLPLREAAPWGSITAHSTIGLDGIPYDRVVEISQIVVVLGYWPESYISEVHREQASFHLREDVNVPLLAGTLGRSGVPDDVVVRDVVDHLVQSKGYSRRFAPEGFDEDDETSESELGISLISAQAVAASPVIDLSQPLQMHCKAEEVTRRTKGFLE